ncbi:MAG: AcrB/AcrD/AcrF family protein [Acidobacteriaceae bacterium]|nr:AcrB/AcrD/AcrF family protein [Acidobacteriaceae bacterium]
MYSPATLSAALLMTMLSAVFWGSWANTYKGVKNYPFELFYWDYIAGVILCSFGFALTLGSFGGTGESFLTNLHLTDGSNIFFALVAGFIFNAANLLLVAGIDIAGLSIAFPIAIGIAVVEGVLLSYALQPRGSALYLAIGITLAIVAIVCDAKAYRRLIAGAKSVSRKGILVNVSSGLLMGAFAPFVTRSLTSGHPLTPYSIAALFSVGAFLCCFVVNVYFMKHPLVGSPVPFSGFWKTGSRNHLLGIAGGIIWGAGGCFNFIAAGFVGVPISYAIGQSAPMIAALWGVLVWKEFAAADKIARLYLTFMFLCYIAAVSVIALAYRA